MSESYLPQVDIISACRNSARYLPVMIESVLHQDYPKCELFIQDGGSTDGSIDILRRYPIQWASEPDNGISQALNRAIKATRGEIIGFTCTDDLVQPGAVSEAVETFRINPQVIMVYGDCYCIDLDGRPFKLWRSKPFDLDWLFWECYIPYQTVYIRRQALYEVGGFDETLKLVQDLDLWLRLGMRFPCESFVYIQKVQGCYRVRDGSAGLASPLVSADGLLRIMDRILSDPDARIRVTRGKKRAMAGMLLMLTGQYLAAREKRFAWKTYRRAFGAYPLLLLTRKGILTLLLTIAGGWLWRAKKRIEYAWRLARPLR